MKWLTKIIRSSSLSNAKSPASVLRPVPSTCELSELAGWQAGPMDPEGYEWAVEGWTRGKASRGKQQHALSASGSSVQKYNLHPPQVCLYELLPSGSSLLLLQAWVEEVAQVTL